MRISLITSATVLALTSASFTASAADTPTLAVAGAPPPATCNVSLSAPSIDLDHIVASALWNKLNDDSHSTEELPVSCDAESQITIQTTDGRIANIGLVNTDKSRRVTLEHRI